MNLTTQPGRLVAGLTIAICAVALTSQALAQQDPNEGRKRGARSGALLGLTMGALTGEAKYAVAGAVAGGVAGGTAGSWSDYQNDREDYRAETLAAGIASVNTGGQGEAPQGWQNIDAFVGQWNVAIWSLDAEGQRVDATAQAVSRLDTTQSVTFSYSNFRSEALDEEVTGTTTLSFQADRGFQLLNQFSTAAEGNRYVGHFDNQANKYNFFYAGSNMATFTGVQRSDYRIEMRLIGTDVILVETWAMVGSEEKRVQSYRFTRG